MGPCSAIPNNASLLVGACVLNFADESVLAVNDQLRVWLGKQSESISIKQILALLPGLDVANSVSNSSESLNSSRRTTLLRNGEEPIPATVHIGPLETDQQTWHLLLIHSCEQPGHLVAYTDVVTGLPDRRALDDWRQQWRHKNPGKPCPHALLFLDLNDFKQINDQHGHTHGDRILALLAERWQNSLRGEDLVVRYGGDEFVVLIAGVQSAEAARPVIERLKACTSATLEVEQTSFSVSVSIGLALAEDIKVPLEELLATADRDMYAQKGQA